VKRMPQRDRGDPAVDVAKFLCGRWAWFGWLFADRREVVNVRIEGFSARHDGVTWWVVVRGLRYEPLEYVVAFGRAERLYDAFRNVTTSIARGHWATDRYRRVQP